MHKLQQALRCSNSTGSCSCRSRCEPSQAHEESCVSNGLRMYAAEMVMDQGKTWLAQAGKLIDWRKAANGLGELSVV
eukprot:2372-Heterococcus_DN1.PRE.1